jgi:hypothetical protein
VVSSGGSTTDGTPIKALGFLLHLGKFLQRYDNAEVQPPPSSRFDDLVFVVYAPGMATPKTIAKCVPGSDCMFAARRKRDHVLVAVHRLTWGVSYAARTKNAAIGNEVSYRVRIRRQQTAIIVQS